MTSKVILAQLTQGLFPHSWALLLPLALPAALVNAPLLGLPTLLPAALEAWYLHLVVVVSLSSYALSAHAVLGAFCGYLGIRALRIPWPNAACDGYAPVVVVGGAHGRAHQSPAIGAPAASAPERERDREREGQHDERGTYPPLPTAAAAAGARIPPASSSSPSSPLRPARAAAAAAAAGAAQRWLDPSRALRVLRQAGGPASGEGEGGRKRSNTSERERGVGMVGVGVGDGARRVARVG
ncbi:hypothetical protein JCM3770_007161 [Rhodotorula araucariae]